jgi:hypothetical protein
MKQTILSLGAHDCPGQQIVASRVRHRTQLMLFPRELKPYPLAYDDGGRGGLQRCGEIGTHRKVFPRPHRNFARVSKLYARIARRRTSFCSPQQASCDPPVRNPCETSPLRRASFGESHAFSRISFWLAQAVSNLASSVSRYPRRSVGDCMATDRTAAYAKSGTMQISSSFEICRVHFPRLP